MAKPPRKSKVSGLFKECRHLSWDKCPCLWLGRFKKAQRRVNLAKWAGVPGPLTRTAATDILKEMQGLVLTGKFHRGSRIEALQGDKLKVAEAIAEYESHRTWKGKGRKTFRSAFETEFGEWSLVQLATTGKLNIEAWLLRRRRESNWSKVNMHRYFEYVNAFFNWAGPRGKGWVQLNPCDTVTSMGNGRGRKRNTRITAEQEADLMRTVASQNDPMLLKRFVGALHLGLRFGELQAIKVRDIDFKTWKIALHDPKGDEPQIVFVETEQVRRILEQRAFLGPQSFVFGTVAGHRVDYTTFRRAWTKWFKDSGLPTGRKEGLVWHDLRHEFVSYLLDRQVPIHEVKELARHKNIATTMAYVTAQEDRLRAGAAKMGERKTGTED